MDYFQFLPVEIKLDILTRVPAESVPDCKSVCTNWLSVVRHPKFSKMHVRRHLNHADDSGTLGFLACTRDETNILKFHYFEYNENHDESTTSVQRMRWVNLISPSEEIRFEGSSNGLICLDDGLDDEYVIICNPITREYVLLPKPKKNTYVGGFGYVSSTGEYKVVGIRESKRRGFHESGFAQVYVYTLGSGKGWRNLGKFKSEFDILSGWDDTSGIVANGAIYWHDTDSEIILSFDLAEEKFSQNLSEPPLPEDSGWRNRGIGVLNGFLFVVMGLKGDGFNDVWMLKKKIDNHGMEVGDERQSSLGWSKEFRVEGAHLLAITKSGGVLDSDHHHLKIYDTKTSIKKTLVKFKNFVSNIYPHKNTLVSLKELGEEDTKTMESVGIEETRSEGQLQEDADADPEFIFS